MSTYRITNVDVDTRSVCIICDVDDIEQHISNVPLDDSKALVEFLNDYVLAYEKGLAKPVIDSKVTALVGVVQTAVPPEQIASDSQSLLTD